MAANVMRTSVKCGVIARELDTKDRNAKKVGTSLPRSRFKENKLR